jgi:hypothetical protein
MMANLIKTAQFEELILGGSLTVPLREDQQEYGKLVRQDASEWEQGSRDVKEGLPSSLIALFTFLEHTLVRKRITSCRLWMEFTEP